MGPRPRGWISTCSFSFSFTGGAETILLHVQNVFIIWKSIPYSTYIYIDIYIIAIRLIYNRVRVGI